MSRTEQKALIVTDAPASVAALNALIYPQAPYTHAYLPDA